MVAYYFVSWWYMQLFPSILNIMQVVIYECLHLLCYSIGLHNIWFHGGTGNCGPPFSILCKSSFMNIYICHGVPYACIIFGFVVVQTTVAVHSEYYASRHL